MTPSLRRALFLLIAQPGKVQEAFGRWLLEELEPASADPSAEKVPPIILPPRRRAGCRLIFRRRG